MTMGLVAPEDENGVCFHGKINAALFFVLRGFKESLLVPEEVCS
jgi:hypothetical protein